MFRFSSTAFEGEFKKGSNTADATVVVTSNIMEQINSMASTIKNALRKFAITYTGHPSYVFDIGNDIAGSLVSSNDEVHTIVDFALDIQVVFERQSDDPILLTISSKEEFRDGITDTQFAQMLYNLRNKVVSMQYGSLRLVNEFLPIQVSVNVREIPFVKQTKTLTLYGGLADVFTIYDLTLGTEMATCATALDSDHGTITFEYYVSHRYEIYSRFGGYTSFDWTGVLSDLDVNTLYLRPDKFAYWFGVVGENVNIGNNCTPVTMYQNTHCLRVAVFNNYDSAIQNVRSGLTADTDKCNIVYEIPSDNAGLVNVVNDIYANIALTTGHDLGSSNRLIDTNPTTDFKFYSNDNPILYVFALYFD